MYLAHLSILYQTKVQSYQNVFFVVAHTLTGNSRRNGIVVNYIIISSVVLDADLRTVLIVWMALCFHNLIMTSIGDGGGIRHVLKPSLSVVIWMNFCLVARMDIILGNMKMYQRLLGIVSVMTIINISCYFTDYCPHLTRFTMLQIFLT